MRGLNWRIGLWTTYVLLLGLCLGALLLLSRAVRTAELSEAQAKAAARQSENQRLALWRLDTALAPLVAQENLRPLDNYLAASGNDNASARLPSRRVPTAAIDPPTLPLRLDIVERFEWTPRTGWRFVIAQQPSENSPISRWTELSAAEIQLYLSCSPAPAEADVQDPDSAESPIASADRRLPSGSLGLSRDAVEFSQRAQSIDLSNRLQLEMNVAVAGDNAVPDLLTACWYDGELLLVRQTGGAEPRWLQGCRVDWQQLKSRMRQAIADLLPEADFQPVSGQADDAAERRGQLAALPIELRSSEQSAMLLELPRASTWTLQVAWISTLTALAAAGLLLAGMQRLSQRRAAFVAAVTHELRTPLTTFQLYTDMLASGMIDDAARRKTYLETLRAESSRLNHLVENVLAYSRLERGRAFAAVQPVTVAALLDKIKLRLEAVAARSDMRIEYQLDPAADIEVAVNPSLVEQILLNLVDNACKYAASAEDRRIIIGGAVDADQVTLSVQDFGPGFSHRRGWPRPFSKTVEQAAASAPGIGLGLSLSRRLARQLGGRLRHQPSASGTRMELSLPRSKGSAVSID